MIKLNQISCLVLLLMCQSYMILAGSLITDTNMGNMSCVPFAYGDFNADKLVDVFCVVNYNIIEAWLGVEVGTSRPLFTRYLAFSLTNKNAKIVNIIPGDFNGDSIMDVLVVSQVGEPYSMSLFKGKKEHRYDIALDNEIILEIQLEDQPFAADFDGDGKIDLLVQRYGKEPKNFLSFNDIGDFIEKKLDGDDPGSFRGYAHSLTDINNDYKPDFILTTLKNNSPNSLAFNQYILDSSGKYVSVQAYNPPTLNIYGQSIFADFDSDGKFEHLLPGCKDLNCEQSVIHIYKDNQWFELDIDFGNYGFIPPNENKDLWASNNISVKTGDYDLDGFIDLLVILRSKDNKKNEKYAILMKNVFSDSNAKFKRTFKIDDHIISLFSYSSVVQASFFDIYENGYLDILFTIKEKENEFKVVAYINDNFDDVYFLKVMVIPGTCISNTCPNSSLPYGLNYPGALVRIITTSYDFKQVVSYACQMSQSSYIPLQLPYTIFGLGSTPNFIDELKVGIIFSTGRNTQPIQGSSKEWHQIIPNSQLIINPYPRESSSYWKSQLFITPSKNILMTVISLGSTMVCLIIIIGILQFRERKIDEKERKLESQRFHFDGL